MFVYFYFKHVQRGDMIWKLICIGTHHVIYVVPVIKEIVVFSGEGRHSRSKLKLLAQKCRASKKSYIISEAFSLRTA